MGKNRHNNKRYNVLVDSRGFAVSKYVDDTKVLHSSRYINPMLGDGISESEKHMEITGERLQLNIHDGTLKTLLNDGCIEKLNVNSLKIVGKDEDRHVIGKQIVNRIEMDIDSDNALAVVGGPEDSYSSLYESEFNEYYGEISLWDVVSDSLDKRITRRHYYEVQDVSSKQVYTVPASLITIGGSSGMGKTGLDMKISNINGLLAIADILQIEDLLVKELVAPADVPKYVQHRLSRLKAIVETVGDVTINVFDKNGVWLEDRKVKAEDHNTQIQDILAAQVGYIHMEEPCRDAIDIVLPKTKGLKVYSSKMRSDMAGTTIDSLTSMFFSVSGGAMSGGWNPSEAKALIGNLDKFSNSYNHPIVAVVNYLNFTAEGQRGIMTVCRSMASMHIDLSLKTIALRTSEGHRPLLNGNVKIIAAKVVTYDNDKSSIIREDVIRLDGSINDQLTQIAGRKVILPSSYIDMFSPDKSDDPIADPLTLVIDVDVQHQNNGNMNLVHDKDYQSVDPSAVTQSGNGKLGVINSNKVGPVRSTVSSMLLGKVAANSVPNLVQSSSIDGTQTDLHVADVKSMAELEAMGTAQLKLFLRSAFLRSGDAELDEVSRKESGALVNIAIQILMSRNIDIDSINEIIDRNGN